MLADAGAPTVLAAPEEHLQGLAGLRGHEHLRAPAVLACSSGGCARTSCAPSAVRSPAASASPFLTLPEPAAPNRRLAAPPCCRQPAPRGTRGTVSCPAASRARSAPLPPARATGPAPASSPCPFATCAVTARPRQDHVLLQPRRRWRDGAREVLRLLRAP